MMLHCKQSGDESPVAHYHYVLNICTADRVICVQLPISLLRPTTNIGVHAADRSAVQALSE